MAVSSSFKLSLPIDIPWKKVCVTEDMMDRVVCDVELPPKWQSSVAVFEYVPDDEYQLFPDYKITYLKVTATITGYQPLDEEIQGEIDWDGVNVETIDGLTELLNSYYPCTGAILQIVVGPPGADPSVPLDRYPCFLDFEPKKRELYEMATDTKEKQSRSIETLNISKSAGTTQSLEILDVDMGGGGFGIQATYAGTGGGFNFQGSQGQWGTKSLNTQQSQVNRTTESGIEKRETYSHTTQLSQMYHLLDSYHLGTNRAVFFIQPRPHVIEEPSGFVRGPRKCEGIQEFFLVVAQLKDQEKEFCLSVRLDTGHLVETDILDYDRRTDISDLASASAPIPTRNDIPDGTTTREACFFACWDVTYNCYRTHDVVDQVYTAPDGYIIESYNTIVNETFHGSTSVSIAPGNKTLTVHAEAHGHICFEGSGVCVDCPDEIEKWSGYARRQVQVNLRSEEPIVKVGTQQQFLVTTRGLCCCPDEVVRFPGIRITGVWDIPDYFRGRFYYDPKQLSLAWQESRETLPEARYLVAGVTRPKTSAQKIEDSCNYSNQAGRQEDSDGYYERRISIRQANGMIDFIREQMVKSFRDPRPGYEPKRFVETDFFFRKLENYVRRSRLGRLTMLRKAKKLVPDQIVVSVAKHFNKDPKDVKVSDILRIRNHEFLRLINMKPEEVARMKMNLLGVQIAKEKREKRSNEKKYPKNK